MARLLRGEDRQMTVWIYVNTSKQVGDRDHLKVFANADAAETWLEENDPRAWPLSTRFWNEPDWPPTAYATAVVRLAGAGIAVAAPAIRTMHRGRQSLGDYPRLGLRGTPGAVQNSLPIGAPSVRSPTKGRPASVNRRAYLADYDDQPTLRFSADSLPRFATTS